MEETKLFRVKTERELFKELGPFWKEERPGWVEQMDRTHDKTLQFIKAGASTRWRIFDDIDAWKYSEKWLEEVIELEF